MHQAHRLVTILTLGTAQDGGYPHTGCRSECCVDAWKDTKLKRLVSSMAILSGNDSWLIDITPDFRHQLRIIETELNGKTHICGIFISHAHLGHYMGLLELGLEVMNTNNIPVYVMPKMKAFLEGNAPFTQLIELNNIKLKKIEGDVSVQINDNFSIKPFQVPHRNEFSETVGYQIQTSHHSVLYIPDIDSWDKWDVDINEMIKANDIAVLDGTYYDKSELKTRDITIIPHPSISESMSRFSALNKMDRKVLQVPKLEL